MRCPHDSNSSAAHCSHVCHRQVCSEKGGPPITAQHETRQWILHDLVHRRTGKATLTERSLVAARAEERGKRDKDSSSHHEDILKLDSNDE